MAKLTPEQIKQRWLQQNKKVCICKGIPRKKFIAAIEKERALTKEEVNILVGSGSGGCRGRRCGPVIEQMLHAHQAGVLV